MIARNEAFPPAAIFLMYAIGLFPFLIICPTKRGQVGAAFGIGACLSLLCSIPAIAPAPSGVSTRHPCLTHFKLRALGDPPGRNETDSEFFCGPGIENHVPSARTALAGFIAIPAFFSAAWVIGGLNGQRELRADVSVPVRPLPQP